MNTGCIVADPGSIVGAIVAVMFLVPAAILMAGFCRALWLDLFR